MKIGDKLVLVHWKFSPTAYTDQMGIAQPGIIAEKVYDVEVVATQKSKGNYGGKMHDGYKAVTTDGREFTCQWESFDDASMSAYSNWNEPAAANGRINEWLLHEATNLMESSYRPLVAKDGKPFTHPRILRCEKHRTCHYTDEMCFMCEHVDHKGKTNGEESKNEVQQPVGP